MIDNTDKQILTILQKNSRTPNSEIARQIGMAPSGVLERMRKLEHQGIIKGYSVQLDADALELGFAAYVFVRTDDMVGETKTAKLLAQIPEVLEAHHIAGEDCFLLKVRAYDTKHFADILRDKIGKIKTVKATRSTIVLGTVKETTALPLEEEK